MTSRDFYLLVRSYFQERSKILYCKDDGDVLVNCYVRKNQLEKEILKELERFTEQEQEELPFKD